MPKHLALHTTTTDGNEAVGSVGTPTQYREAAAKITKAERARDAYAAASALGFQQMADAEVANLARELGINPDLAQRLIQMPEGIWRGIKETITLPGNLPGK